MLEFQAEIQAFEAALPELLARHGGEYAVIKGADVAVQTFPTYADALDWGYTRFGLEQFCVKRISDAAHSVHFRRGIAA